MLLEWVKQGVTSVEFMLELVEGRMINWTRVDYLALAILRLVVLAALLAGQDLIMEVSLVHSHAVGMIRAIVMIGLRACRPTE